MDGHVDDVVGCSFSADGAKVVSCSNDWSVRVWDGSTGRQIAVMNGHTSGVRGCSFSPDGTKVVSCSRDSSVRVWDSSTGQQTAMLNGHTSNVVGCSFSPDGTKVVSCSVDKSVRVWDGSTGQQIAVMNGHTSSVYGCSFSPDGTKVLSCSDDSDVRVWDSSTGQQIAAMNGHNFAVYECSFSPDGTKVVSCSSDKSVRVWDSSTGRQIAVMNGHTSNVFGCSFSPDGTKVVSCSNDKSVRVWDGSTGEQLRVMNGHTSYVNKCSFSPDGTKVVSCGNDKSVRVWDGSTGQHIAVMNGHTDKVNKCSFSRDGTKVVSCSGDKSVRVWDSSTGQRIVVMNGHTADVYGCSFSSNGNKVVSCSNDKSIRVWDGSTGKQIAVMNGHTGGVFGCAFSPDGTKVLSCGRDKSVRVWDSRTGQQIVVMNGHTNYVNGCSFSPDGTKVVSCSNDSSVRVWDSSTGQQITVINEHTSNVRGCSFSPDSSKVVSCSSDKSVRVWDSSTGQQIAVMNGHTREANGCSFSPDGTKVVSCGTDKSVRVWDGSTGRQIAVMNGHNSNVNGCSFSPDGTKVVSCSGDSSVRLWDSNTGQQIAVMNGHTGYVYGCSFSPDGTKVLSCGDESVRVWDIAFVVCDDIWRYLNSANPVVTVLTHSFGWRSLNYVFHQSQLSAVFECLKVDNTNDNPNNNSNSNSNSNIWTRQLFDAFVSARNCVSSTLQSSVLADAQPLMRTLDEVITREQAELVGPPIPCDLQMFQDMQPQYHLVTKLMSAITQRIDWFLLRSGNHQNSVHVKLFQSNFIRVMAEHSNWSLSGANEDSFQLQFDLCRARDVATICIWSADCVTLRQCVEVLIAHCADSESSQFSSPDGPIVAANGTKWTPKSDEMDSELQVEVLGIEKHFGSLSGWIGAEIFIQLNEISKVCVRLELVSSLISPLQMETRIKQQENIKLYRNLLLLTNRDNGQWREKVAQVESDEIKWLLKSLKSHFDQGLVMSLTEIDTFLMNDLYASAEAQRRPQHCDEFVPIGKRAIPQFFKLFLKSIATVTPKRTVIPSRDKKMIETVIGRLEESLRLDVEALVRGEAESQAVDILKQVYSETRTSHKSVYENIMNGVRQQQQFHDFIDRADQLSDELNKQRKPNQQHKDLVDLMNEAYQVKLCHGLFLSELSDRTGGTFIEAELKGMGRCVEKAGLTKDNAKALLNSGNQYQWRYDGVCDIVRGAVEFENMTQMFFFLELLAACDPEFVKGAKQRGWDATAVGLKQQIRILRIKNRFGGNASSGGWADCMVNFTLLNSVTTDSATAVHDTTFNNKLKESSHIHEGHVCEVQLVHSNMMLARKNMGAHKQYERFRSAMELLETLGHSEWIEHENKQQHHQQQHQKIILSNIPDDLNILLTSLQNELSETKKKLSDTKQELSDTKNSTKMELSDLQQKLSETHKVLSDTRKELSDTKKVLSDTIKESATKKELSDTKKELSDIKKEFAVAMALVNQIPSESRSRIV